MSALAEATIDRSASVQIVDPRLLQPGDIIISSGSRFESWLIRTATAHDATHVAVHIGSGIGIEANDPGVVPVYFPAMAYDRSAKLRVKRHSGLSPDQREKIVRFVEAALYRPYSTRGAVATILPLLRKQSDPGYFCSMLVAAAYASVDCAISRKTPFETTPGHIAEADNLADAPDVIKDVPAFHHGGVAGGLQRAYEAYLASGNHFERSILPELRKISPVFEATFNVFDTALRVEGLSTSSERDVIDGAIARIFRSLGENGHAFPSISIARTFGLSGGNLAGNLIWTAADLQEDVHFRVYEDTFWQALISAMSWERDRRNAQIAAVTARAKDTRLRTYIALLGWALQTVNAERKIGRLAHAVVSTDYMQQKLQQLDQRQKSDLELSKKDDPKS
ncbi:hypothetical protein CWO91_13675 [Bradyrhizobium genosp. SA-3]|uniref:hypothetical protein n=1 Tax=Bradyrhizobium genosp. SA-3 TaxID=508868 RepID=UPI0010293B9C|nr:hypothetical protein [Bradyrhizobium genosp. SA-3]RZN10364.1 hypothetical protein CWO91_13675 [Bradyrhizobium genosp. SA-3]